MTTHTSNWIYIGNFSDLDTNESDDVVEDAGTLVGTTFSTSNNPDMQFLAATYSEPDNDNDFETNNQGSAGDLVSYDAGSGTQSSRVDSHWDYSADVLLSNGSTITKNLGMIQLENGDLFINGDNLNNLEITSITPTSISNSGYDGWFGSRNISNSSIVCYASGTLIATEHDAVEVQCLRVGDKVMTVDRGFQVVRWVGCRRFKAADITTNPVLRPVCIRAGALGDGLPKRDLLVSQQHRMLVRSKVAGRMFRSHEVLVPAKQLVGLAGIDYTDDVREITYCHFLCNQHEIIFAEGAQTESLFTGPQALQALNHAARAEIFAIFPELSAAPDDAGPTSARLLVKGRTARRLVARHKANDRSVFIGSLKDFRHECSIV